MLIRIRIIWCSHCYLRNL